MDRATADQVISAGFYTIAINNSWELAPDADVLIAVDPEWWAEYPEALAFTGEKIVMRQDAPPGVTFVKPAKIGRGSNGALQAVHWVMRGGARRVLLFGVDLRPDELTHHHGFHRGTLANPTPDCFDRARRAWKKFATLPGRPEVFNCSERSALQCFPKMTLEDALSREPV